MAEPVYGFKDRETAERLKVIAREPIDLTSARRGSSLPSPKGAIVVAIFDGSRNGKRYTGHIWTGTQGAAIQWIFDWGNDPGTANIIGANEFVEVVKCPAWLESHAAFGAVATYGEKYVAKPPIWAVLA